MEINIPSLVRIKPNALAKIGKYLKNQGFTEIALLYGEGLENMLGASVSESLDNFDVKASFVKAVSESDVEYLFQLSLTLPKAVRAIVSIGGGKVIDCGKYLAFLAQIPFISVPTAISNDGFCSPLSSLVVKGRRKTLKTVIPDGLIVDTEIIKGSPMKFIYSGIGDLFCKITSIYDWKLAFKRKGEYVNDFACMVSRSAVDAFIYCPNKDLQDLEYLRVLATSLLMNGLAMEIAGSSRPASGSEHLISHAYEKVAKTPSMHGLQVGAASYAISYLQRETHALVKKVIQETGFADFMSRNKLSKACFIEAVKLAPTIKENYYTILSEENSFEKLVNFLEQDELMKQMLEE